MVREHVHLIGIGGSGMTALAGLLQADGCRVTGSDGPLYPPSSTILERLGIEPQVGFDAARLDPAPDLVVVGNAVSRGNPEVEETLDRDLPYTSMARLVGERFLASRHSIVVAGTHGKTTTCSMIAWILSRAGLEPGYLIGGSPGNFDLPFDVGTGSMFVVEGDEYDTAFFDKGPKFMHYRPDTAVLGTVEFDHADIYRDLEEVTQVFGRLTRLVPRRGLIVRHEDCELTRQVTREAFSRIEGFGLSGGRWRASDITSGAEGSRFTVTNAGEPWATVDLPTGGEHNVRNALAALAVARELGVEARVAAEALADFRGVRRRLELLGEVDDVLVLDDFAHHPTAIDETLRAVRHRYPGRRLWAVLEPRSWSLRRNVFQDRLATVFDAADEVLIAAVYRSEDVEADRRLDTDRLVAAIARRGPRATFEPDAAAIARRVLADAAPGDVVVVMSNGSFDGLHQALLDGLEARARSSRRARRGP